MLKRLLLFWASPVLGINCTALVPRPRDVSPIRSPQSIHEWLSERFRGLDIVEVGTRNGDGMMCFAQTARTAVAVEIERSYCDILRRRSANLQRRALANFTVVCADFRRARLDGDVFTWWEQAPHLTNIDAVTHLRREVERGHVRKSAEAVVLFDMSWRDDVKSLQTLIEQAAWTQNINFDEEALCLRKQQQMIRDGRRRKDSSESCERAKGRFIVAGIPLLRLPRLTPRTYTGEP